MANTVLTAPLAIIKIGGVAIGKMQNITFDENTNRVAVRGIGNLTPDEVPAVTWDGTLTCSQYSIDFSKALNQINDGKGGQQRVVNTVDEFVNTVLLQDEGLTLDIMRKVVDTKDPVTGVVTPKLEIFMSVKGCFQNRDGITIAEGQVSNRNASFMYINPVIYPQ